MSDSEQNTAAPAAGNDVPPDHLAIHPASPHFDADKLRRGVGIRFKGAVRTNVEEYCISEGWIRVAAGRSLDRFGNAMTIKLQGPVEVWFEDTAQQGDDTDAKGDEA